MKGALRSLIPALTITILIIISLFPLALPQPTQQVSRIIEVNEYGLLYVSDTVPRNGDITEISFPRELVKFMVNYRSAEDPEPELIVSGDLFTIRVRSDSGEVVHLITIFRDVIERNPDGSFTLSFPITPILAEGGGTLKLRVILPRGSTIMEKSPEFLKEVEGEQGVLEAERKDLDFADKSPQSLMINFRSGDLKLLDITEATLRVDLTEEEISLKLRIRNLGGSALNSLTMYLPEASRVIEVRDPLGRIRGNFNLDKKTLTVNLREGIDEGEAGSIEVIFKPEISIEAGGGSLNIGLILPLNLTIRVYNVEAVLNSVELISTEPEVDKLERVYPETLVLGFTFTHIDPFNYRDFQAKIDYRKSFSRFAILPYLWAAAIIIAVGSIVSVYVRRGRPEVVGPGGELLREADSLSADYLSAADLITSQKILDKGFIRPRILELRSDVKKRVGKLIALVGDVRKAMPGMEEKLRELADSARKLEEEVDSLWIATHSYLTGRMGRSAFRRVAEDHLRRMREAHRRFTETLEDLRSRLS